MTKRSANNRRSSAGQALIPIALLALVALIGGLVYHTRFLEASHRATAESVLRDYAALAAWQYNQRAENYLESTAWVTLRELDEWFRHSSRPLPPPHSLVQFGKNAGTCGLGGSARFAFRIDLPGRTAAFAGDAPVGSVRDAIVERFATLGASEAMARQRVRMFLDTVGGAPRAVALGVIRDRDSVPLAVYGVEADPAAVVSFLRKIPSDKPLLPPSLLRGQPTDSVLTVHVQFPNSTPLTTIGSAVEGRFASDLPMSGQAGGLLTRVVIRPEAAAMLLIGGMPPSRLGMLVLLLIGSVILVAIALQQLRRGRELARLRTRFVANVSHELRTPLAQISMFSETLLLGRARSAEERQDFMSIIFREAKRLRHLVESVLKFSRAEASAGAQELRVESRDIALEVRDAVRAFTPLAAAAGVELRTDLEENALAQVEPDGLRQIVLNLLDNAVKFGPEGQQVSVSVQRTASDVIVAVTDQGPGIPEQERRQVFAPFVQGANSQSRTTAGAGIGLSVVADLVAAHGGRVWIEDGLDGRGARVAFALPALEQKAPKLTPVPTYQSDDREAVLTAR